MAQQLDLAHFRKLLEDERARILHEIEDLRSIDSTVSQEDEQGDLSSYDEHIGDTGTETFERERDVALGENAEAILRQVETALQKIDDGTYGICERCGKPIGKARLEALPYAALAIGADLVCAPDCERREATDLGLEPLEPRLAVAAPRPIHKPGRVKLCQPRRRVGPAAAGRGIVSDSCWRYDCVELASCGMASLDGHRH